MDSAFVETNFYWKSFYVKFTIEALEMNTDPW